MKILEQYYWFLQDKDERVAQLIKKLERTWCQIEYMYDREKQQRIWNQVAKI